MADPAASSMGRPRTTRAHAGSGCGAHHPRTLVVCDGVAHGCLLLGWEGGGWRCVCVGEGVEVWRGSWGVLVGCTLAAARSRGTVHWQPGSHTVSRLNKSDRVVPRMNAPGLALTHGTVPSMNAPGRRTSIHTCSTVPTSSCSCKTHFGVGTQVQVVKVGTVLFMGSTSRWTR